MILGSGMSFHNMQVFMSAMGGGGRDSDVAERSAAFDQHLTHVLTNPQHCAAPARAGSGCARQDLLIEWRRFPHAAFCHPPGGEEHLAPLFVCAGKFPRRRPLAANGQWGLPSATPARQLLPNDSLDCLCRRRRSRSARAAPGILARALLARACAPSSCSACSCFIRALSAVPSRSCLSPMRRRQRLWDQNLFQHRRWNRSVLLQVWVSRPARAGLRQACPGSRWGVSVALGVVAVVCAPCPSRTTFRQCRQHSFEKAKIARGPHGKV